MCPHMQMSAAGWAVFQTTLLSTPIWKSLARVNPITEGNIIPFWGVGWTLRTCSSRLIFLNSGCHLKAVKSYRCPGPAPDPPNQNPPNVFKLSGDLNEQKRKIAGPEPLEYKEAKHTHREAFIVLAPKCIQAAIVGIWEEGWPRNEAIVSMTDYSSEHKTNYQSH